MSSEDENEVFTEVYHTDSTFVAQKILDVILNPEGISALIHDRQDAAFPTNSQGGGRFVAVKESQRDEALRLLNEAIENGYLDKGEGSTIPRPTP